jgi:DNA-binding LacI/PurR family transcriptional regulator
MSSNTVFSQSRLPHPADRCTGILEEIRAQIVAGTLAPGARLLTRRDLATSYATTLATVQKSLSRLEAAGFVSSRGRGGSYVADRPPHLFRFGIVFPEIATSGSEGWYWSKYCSLLAKAAHETAEARQFQFAAFSGVRDWHHSEDAIRLVADVKNHMLAGLIVVGSLVPDSPLSELVLSRNIPVVQIAERPGIASPSVTHGAAKAMVARRLGSLVSGNRGSGHVALMIREFLPDSVITDAAAELNRVGLDIDRSQVIGLDPREPRWARNWVRLLMQSRTPPQAIWITDDNFVEDAARGLADAGVGAGRDVTVVAIANFPLDVPNPDGFIRYGVNLRDMLETAFDQLINKNSNARDTVSVIPARWMDETPA